MKIKLSKSQWEQIGKTAGWTDLKEHRYESEQEPQNAYSIWVRNKRLMQKFIGINGTCPICGNTTTIKNLTEDGRFMTGTCDDSFTLDQWKNTSNNTVKNL